MISKKVFLADGSNNRFLSDFIIRSEQFTRVYNYMFDPLGIDGTVHANGLFIRVTDYPTSDDLQTINKWDLVDNSISFYVAPLTGSRIYIEVATTPEEFGDTLVQPAIEKAEAAAEAALVSEQNALISENAAATSANESAASAVSSASSADDSNTSALASEASQQAAFASETAAAASEAAALVSKNAAATSASEALASENASAASAASSLSHLNEFKGTYYGQNTVDPTTDPLGGAMTAGDLYFNTTALKLKVYTGSQWDDATTKVVAVHDEFTATADQTTFTTSEGYDFILVVTINGITLAPSDYTATDGLTVVLDVAAVVDDTVVITHIAGIDITDVYTKTQSDANYYNKTDTYNKTEVDVDTYGIESGSNSNGSWTKFPDGTLICRTRNIFTTTSTVTWTYPVAFVETPVTQAESVHGGISDPDLPYYSAEVSTTDALYTSCKIIRYKVVASTGVWTSTTDGFFIGAIAIGRWK